MSGIAFFSFGFKPLTISLPLSQKMAEKLDSMSFVLIMEKKKKNFFFE